MATPTEDMVLEGAGRLLVFPRGPLRQRWIPMRAAVSCYKHQIGDDDRTFSSTALRCDLSPSAHRDIAAHGGGWGWKFRFKDQALSTLERGR